MMIRLLDRLMIGSYKASDLDLAVLRVVTACIVLVSFAPKWNYLPDAPSFLFSPPPGTPSLLPSPPPRLLIDFANLAVIASATALLLGVFIRASSIVTTLSLLLLNSIGYALGKINHDILIVLLPLFMAYSGWGRCLSVQSAVGGDPRLPRHRATLGMFALVIALSMTYAGLAKLGSGWLELDSQSSLAHLATNHYANGRVTLLGGIAIERFPIWVHELADWATVIFELSFLPALFAPALFRATLIVALFFHLGVLLTYDIAFISNIAAYAAFAPLGMLVSRNLNLKLGYWPKCIAIVGAISFAVFVAGGESPLDVRTGFPLPKCVVFGGFAIGMGFVLANVHGSLARVSSLANGQTNPVIYFDGECGFCNRWIDFVIAHDTNRRFRFATSQSLLAVESFEPGAPLRTANLDTIVVATESVRLDRSDAILAIYRELRLLRWLVPILSAIPSGLRDVGYDLFASIRYRIGGGRTTCRVPSPQDRELFIDSQISAMPVLQVNAQRALAQD